MKTRGGIVNPRATEAATFERSKTIFIANAITSCTYVLSVPRPRAELGVPLGGPSFAGEDKHRMAEEYAGENKNQPRGVSHPGGACPSPGMGCESPDRDGRKWRRVSGEKSASEERTTKEV